MQIYKSIPEKLMSFNVSYSILHKLISCLVIYAIERFLIEFVTIIVLWLILMKHFIKIYFYFFIYLSG